MSRALSVHADVSVRSPAGVGRVVGSGRRVDVRLPWRLFFALVLDRALRAGSLRGWRFLESRGVTVHLRLPGLPSLNLRRLAFMFSLGITFTLSVAAPLALLH